uniref:Uncharacterized protein n=1 Tax=Octopus bimaculoides TaxID=37653 RepID=A0A0L8H8P1_OCTBM
MRKYHFKHSGHFHLYMACISLLLTLRYLSLSNHIKQKISFLFFYFRTLMNNNNCRRSACI